MQSEHIIADSYHQISEDDKLIKLATITTFLHSLIFVFIIIWNVIMLSSHVVTSIHVAEIFRYILKLFNPDYRPIYILIGIVLLIGQFILPPIGEATVVHYLDDPKSQGYQSMVKGLNSFYKMMELDGMMYFFSLYVFIIFSSRFWILDIINNFLVIFLLVIWLICVIASMIFLPYTKYIIVLEGLPVFESMSKSARLAIEHIHLTMKLVGVSILLNIRILLNIIIVVGVPLIAIFVVIKTGLNNNIYIQYTIYALILALIILVAYINGIIESFFASYRYKAYQHIRQLQT